MIFGLSLALGSALGTNLGFLFKHRGAVVAPRSGCAIHCAAPLICFARDGLRWGGSSRSWPGGCTWGGPETTWEQIDSPAFASFDRPGYAKIAANLSLRSYGDQRTLLSYEARTQATDETARRAFLRYWTLASPGVRVVMRSTFAVIAQKAREAG